MKKVGVNVLILNLLLSIIAISFNMSFVSSITPTRDGYYEGEEITSDNTIYKWSNSLSKWSAVSSADSSTTVTKPASKPAPESPPANSPIPMTNAETYSRAINNPDAKDGPFFDTSSGKTPTETPADKSGETKTTADKAGSFFSNIVTSGTFVGTAINSLWGKGGTFTAEGSAGLNPLYSAGIGLAVSAVVYYYLYKDTSEKIVTFECKNWDAPTGGDDCEKCNAQDGGIPCSEYQCRSLGQSCQLLNDGEVNGSELSELKCVWVNRNDVEYPIITPWEGALTTGYSYSPDNSISPPDKGVKIIDKSSKDGCVKPFSPISFGVLVD